MNPEITTALVKVSSFTELASIVENAKEGVTFFGHRYIYVNGYEGTLSIHALAISMMILRENNFPANQNNQAEKDAFYKIIPQINKLYRQNKHRWIWWNPITYFVGAIRIFWEDYSKHNPGCSPRVFWKLEYGESEIDFSVKPKKLPRVFIPYITKEKARSVITNIPSLAELHPIVEKAKEEVSFFGCRFIYFDDYDGTLPINFLAKRVMELAKDTLVNQEIVSLIDEIYFQNEEKVSKKNLFTRMLCSIRSIADYRFRNNWKQFKNDIK